jgi:uncharacterized protein (DUF305 family)
MRHLGTVLLALVLGVSGCGQEGKPAAAPPPSSTTSPAPSAPNDADVMFAQMMVAHHGQGIEIAKLAVTRAGHPDVKTLAAAIETTQTAERRTMAGWLRAWGKPPTAGAGAHAAHGGMPGTSNIEIRSVKAKSGDDFDRAFLNMLIAHQDDAIQMARSETAGGAHAEAKAMADRIDKSRSAQITQMLAMLDELRAP